MIAIADLKIAARGRWVDILQNVGGCPGDILDGKHHPCVKCGGTDRFRLLDRDAGALFCNHCFAKENGDGISAVMWLTGMDFAATVEGIAAHLGINGHAAPRQVEDLVAEIARRKRMPLESFRLFGAAEAYRGKMKVCRVPVYGPDGKQCSHFDFSTMNDEWLKGMGEKDGKAGLFWIDKPGPEETVLLTEGVKDAAALHGQGYQAIGLPTHNMDVKFARLFSAVHTIIIPDRDKSGEEGARKTAARLFGLAASVRIATLPVEFKQNHGDGVREVLAKRDGPALLKQAIEDAKPWVPDGTELSEQRISLVDSACLRYLDTLAGGHVPMCLSGMAALDSSIDGVAFGEMCIVAARTSHGKAQPLDSLVLTPSGFVPMGEIVAGSAVVGADGMATVVTAVFPQGELDVYQVTFSDGESCECSIDHLWLTQTHNERRRGVKGSVKTLAQIRETLTRTGAPQANHVVPVVAPIEMPEQSGLPLDPYLMGLLLGDGSFVREQSLQRRDYVVFGFAKHCVASNEDEAVADGGGSHRIKRKHKNNQRSRTAQLLAECGLDGCDSFAKFIPDQYLKGSVQQRLELLRGLLDTDGHVSKEGTTIEYSTSSPHLAEQVPALARSLGAVVRTSARIPVYASRGELKDGAESHRVFIRMANGLVPVSSRKHLARLKNGRHYHRAIVSVDWSRRAECQCIRVQAADQLYITDGYTVTHNTMFAMQWLDTAAQDGYPTLMVSEEMSALALGRRALEYLSEVQEFHWPEQLDALRSEVGTHYATRAKMWIAESTRTVDRAVEIIDQLVAENGVKVVAVDYATLLRGVGATKYEQVTYISVALKQCAARNGIALLLLCQMSRDIEKRTNKNPMLSDLRDSGQLEQDADLVLFLQWPFKDDPTYRPVDEYRVYIAKNRNRRTREPVVKLSFRADRQMLRDINQRDPFTGTNFDSGEYDDDF